MVTVRPFKAIRPASGKEARIAALPYDVYNREEARAAVADRPLSFLRIDRPETQFPEDADMYSPAVYGKARELLWGMVADGDFVWDDVPGYYIYEQTMLGRSQTGIVGCASIDDYLEGRIKKHENTRREKEEDRVRHVDACGAQTGPIFLAYRNNDRLKELVLSVKAGPPLFHFTSDDGIRHRGWAVTDAERVEAVRSAFEGMDALYIADGHHRAASAVRVGQMRRDADPDFTGDEEFNYFLSVIFPEDELMIMDYNRVVRDLNGLTTERFLQKIGEVCFIKPQPWAEHPDEKGEMAMLLEGHWYMLTVKPQFRSGDPVEGLDVSILQREILEPILGITDPRKDARIDFIGGIRGFAELERRVGLDMKVAFAMYPTSIRELFAVADEGRLMPPKSTWFEPKLYSGLFIHAI